MAKSFQINLPLKLLFVALLCLAIHSAVAGHKDKANYDDDSTYGRCVGQVINHPLRRDFALHEYSSNFYEDTDKLCRCLSQANKDEAIEGKKGKIAYFFSGREDYFSKVDSCVLNSVREVNYTFFNAALTFDLIVPLIHSRITDTQAPGVMVVLGRGPAQSEKECMTMKVIQNCQKIKSLFFTYKCLKEKFKQVSFFEELEKDCRESPWGREQRI